MARRLGRRKMPDRNRHTEKEADPTEGGVFNTKSMLSLHKLFNKHIIEKIEFPISTGKEADVYLAIAGSAEKVSDARFVALKFFRVYSYNDVTPTLGAFFLSQIRTIIIVAFVLVAIAVFMIFRTPVPSFAVVFGAANDIIVALGVMGLLGIPLGIASVGGLLMLLGYSIDTDMLSSIRVIKRTDSTPEGRAYSSFRTGATMTVTAILSFGVLLVVAYLAYIPTYIEISSVVMAGLLADLVTTWLANMPIILWYKKRKDGVR